MEKKQVVVTEGNPLILAAGGTYGFDTITLMPGGRIRIQARPGNVKRTVIQVRES
jgi:hypothetical protein